MADKKKSKQDKFYGNPPKAERGEDGNMEVKKSEKTKAPLTSDDAGTEGVPVEMRHGVERGSMNHAHENEHVMHDAMGKKDKKEMHQRHLKERSDMFKRHEKELAGKSE